LLFEHSQQRREIVCRRLSNAVDREVMTVRAPLVDFDLEVRASTALMVPLLPERSGKVCREFSEPRLVQLKLGLFDLDDDRTIGKPEIWMGTRCGTRPVRV
jgi:hypothetical protein